MNVNIFTPNNIPLEQIVNGDDSNISKYLCLTIGIMLCDVFILVFTHRRYLPYIPGLISLTARAVIFTNSSKSSTRAMARP